MNNSGLPRNPAPNQIAAYLGYQPARERLGIDAPPPFSLEAMRRGGDRNWRRAMQTLGHQAAAASACAVAELALTAYQALPEALPEVETLATGLVDALRNWQRAPERTRSRMEVTQKGKDFCLAVDVGGHWHEKAGYLGQSLGRALGRCYSVVLSPENPRYVRWLGEAADITSHALNVPEHTVCEVVAASLLPLVHTDGASLRP